jgi:hypothetical protein
MTEFSRDGQNVQRLLQANVSGLNPPRGLLFFRSKTLSMNIVGTKPLMAAIAA